jgi:hypothetical protein
MRKFIIAVVATSIAAHSFAANAQPASSYSELAINEMGDVVQVNAQGQESALNVVQEYSSAKVVTNHAGEFAVISSEAKSNEEISLATISSSSNVELVWDNPENVSGTLIRDGIPIKGIDSEGFYIDNQVKPGDTYEYTIEFAEPPVNSESQDDLIDVAVSGTTAKLPLSTSFAATALVAATPLPEYTILRYLTFIRDKYVPLDPRGCFPLGTHFEGNNRTYSPYATSQQSKTILTVRIDWNTRLFRQWNFVGPTTVVSKQGSVYVDQVTRQASDFWVFARELRPTLSTSAEFVMHTEASNPVCKGLPIYSDLKVLVKPTGNYLIEGKVRFVPNHEFYIFQENTGLWSTIYKKDISILGFNCFDPFLIETTYCIDEVTMTTGGVVSFG